MNTSTESQIEQPRRKSWRRRSLLLGSLLLGSVLLVGALWVFAYNTSVHNTYLYNQLRYEQNRTANQVTVSDPIPVQMQIAKNPFVPRQHTEIRQEGSAFQTFAPTVYGEPPAFHIPVDAAQQLAAQIRALPTETRSKEQIQQLHDILVQQFDRRHQEQVARLKRVLAEAQQTEEVLARRETQKNEIVQRRMTELLGGRDPLNWDYEPSAINSDLGQLPNPLGIEAHVDLSTVTGIQSQPYSDAIGSDFLSPSSQINVIENNWLPNPTDVHPTAENDLQNANAFRAMEPESPARGSSDDRRADGWETRETDAIHETFLRGAAETRAADTKSGSALSAKDLVSAGYRLRAAMREANQARQLYENAALSSTELNRLTDTLEEAETLWKFQTFGLESMLEVRRLEYEAAKDHLANSSDKTEASRMLKVAELALEQLHEQLAWVKEFQQALEFLKPTNAKNGLKAAEAPAVEVPAVEVPAKILPTEEIPIDEELPVETLR